MSDSRKYSIAEIDAMRRSLASSYPSGISYNAVERSAEIEDRLRTYMQNGTEPEELAALANTRIEADIAQQKAMREYHEKQRATAPPPRILSSKEDVLDEWFATCVAQYDGASVTAKDLYDGFGGRTLKSFANQKAPDGVDISQRDMERFLERKKVKSRSAMFALRYDGIRHVMHGDVRSGNYGT